MKCCRQTRQNLWKVGFLLWFYRFEQSAVKARIDNCRSSPNNGTVKLSRESTNTESHWVDFKSRYDYVARQSSQSAQAGWPLIKLFVYFERVLPRRRWTTQTHLAFSVTHRTAQKCVNMWFVRKINKHRRHVYLVVQLGGAINSDKTWASVQSLVSRNASV